eukprot:CAMPEP_0204338454 /NCGR_PEP_ID=MMETSP0469-20131031/21078_1 /ASSEMBLY_ACC=CAM_ASM_000384 /TAXON_ID=2969 /ORGANISM="Oxyrrhis marina" /LENGTH=121 /DNA_ID=CAMNT_0051322639 /DNA_START=292 /DNA_END=657 /DNA_ORIENTATION=-
MLERALVAPVRTERSEGAPDRIDRSETDRYEEAVLPRSISDPRALCPRAEVIRDTEEAVGTEDRDAIQSLLACSFSKASRSSLRRPSLVPGAPLEKADSALGVQVVANSSLLTRLFHCSAN